MRNFFYTLTAFLALITVIGLSTITTLDRTPPREQAYYGDMMARLEALPEFHSEMSPVQVGYSKVSITPDSTMALAGYGARRPKEFNEVLDSVFVRTIVLKNKRKKVAILSADLLIIHPMMKNAFFQLLKDTDWTPNEIYFTATHTHSSIGQWAPGLVGGLFAGDYDERVSQIIAKKFFKSLTDADQLGIAATLSFSESKNPDLVFNRLVHDQGLEDPFLKNVFFKTANGMVLIAAFSAHATCLSLNSHGLSGDFPGAFHKMIGADTSFLFSLYASGPVASMGPETPMLEEKERYRYLGSELAKRVSINEVDDSTASIFSMRLPISMGKPQFKISKNLILRPYLFEMAFGKVSPEISILKINHLLLVGTPCDFSGELALPLYEYAKTKGLELIITSFNGDYAGYITNDEWYDLEKYETRTMAWFGPGNGAYFSEIIKRIIDAAGQD